MTLAAARVKAAEQRRLLSEGQDPIRVKRAAKAKANRETSRRSPKRTSRRKARLVAEAPRAVGGVVRGHVYPIIGSLPVDEIEVDHVLKVLTAIWPKEAITAKRVRTGSNCFGRRAGARVEVVSEIRRDGGVILRSILPPRARSPGRALSSPALARRARAHVDLAAG